MTDSLAGVSICHINLASGFRGGERQAELLIRELAERQVEQRLVVRQGNLLAARCKGIHGLAIHETQGLALGAALACRGANLSHAHEGQSFYAAALANRLFGIPYVLTRRVPNPQKPSPVRSLVYRWSGRLCGVSQAVAENVRIRYPDIDVTVVPDAHAAFSPDPEAVASIRQRFSGKRLIGHAGALDDAHKGQRTLLAAAGKAQQSRPDWHFVLCGDGKDAAVLRDEASGLTNVTFTGFVDNMADYIASFDVFAFPSNFEAMGSSLLDAMYLGVPVVASAVGGIPEIVEDGVNGYLIAPGDAAGLFGNIDRVLGNKAITAAMSAANRDTAARYDAGAMADAYATIYADLLR